MPARLYEPTHLTAEQHRSVGFNIEAIQEELARVEGLRIRLIELNTLLRTGVCEHPLKYHREGVVGMECHLCGSVLRSPIISPLL